MRKINHFLSAFFLLSFLFAVGLNAQPPAGPMDPCATPPEPPKEKPFIPNLSEEQSVQLDKIHEGMRASMDKFRVELCEKETTLKTLRAEESSDESKMLNLIEEIGAVRTAMAKEQLMTENKVKAVLTDTQWKALQKNRPKPPHQPLRPSKKGGE